ncbi:MULTISPECIES: WhiB family transcriptional regulator [Nocardiopsis]|uniref:Transcriptional regulator WhiB n=1 Tax=Nocardiopsis lambiniae TaxID=3075539 RepID=A0ABU2MEG9_9ACTN|nr:MULTISPECIES: WhiB family transcriptional regulator [unclassified Nocardiopsis]MDE3724520.1 WhiB family transcriptional regulator [Nocardiopsis sp. N85]MDT0330957.1 WhiB family transcriptional regulator [Nocardiopsis sp. DSM 44743]
MWIDQWTTRARCRRIDPDALFVQGSAQNRAKLICHDCPVRTECLVDALDNRVEFGVWGGMTERERRALLRKHPQVTDWAPVLDEVRREGDEDLVRDLVRYAETHAASAD